MGVRAPFPHVVVQSDCRVENVSTMTSSNDSDFKVPQIIPEAPEASETIDNARVPPTGLFFIEVIKNGTVIDKKDFSKSEMTFGRSRECDFPLEHPSISRNHASITWKSLGEDSSKGWFILHDNNSTHGTSINKRKLKPGATVKVDVNNNVIKFGGSSRSFMLNSTDPNYGLGEDQGETQEKSLNSAKNTSDDEDEGVELEVLYERIEQFMKSPSAETKNEHAFSSNPAKCLQEWFEREGLDFEYQVTHNNNNFRCNLTITIEGRDFLFEGDPNAKKKDAISSTCTRACRVLDAFKQLFPWQKESRKKRSKGDEDDDDDDVLDETEHSNKEKTTSSTPETYDSLMEKWKDCSIKLSSCKAELASLTSNKKPSQNDETPEEDSLDSYMTNLASSSGRNKTEEKIAVSKIRLQIKELEKKQRVLELLMKAARPTNLPSKLIAISESKIQKKDDNEPKVEKPYTSAVEHKSDKIEDSISQPSSNSDNTKVQSLESDPPVIQMKLSKSGIVSNVFKEEESEVISRPTTIVSSPPAMKKVKLNRDQREVKEHDDQFVDWVPPSEQDGSGKTSLNEKLGY